MTSDGNIIDMDKLTNAVSNKLADNVSAMMKLSMESFEKSLQEITKSNIENISQSVKNEVGSCVQDLMRKQEDYEAKTDYRLDSLEKELKDRQNDLEKQTRYFS